MQYDVLHWSTKDVWPLKSQFNNSFELPCNIKVSIMLYTLQNTLTKKMFENGVKMFLQKQYTDINDLWKVMQTVLYSTSVGVKYNYSIQDIIPSWAELNHYPVVNVKRDYNTFSLNVSVENFNTNISIPVSITTQTYFLSEKIVYPVWLMPPHISNRMLAFDSVIKDDWILVDSQESGVERRIC
ncbi:uncharacterized protein LOC112638428 [Camponotus floridanus]|uniref:uncharacterized protein LOC112638428 n=1 Tax=Camponotus floridanus TaxID=104421 RepID=UPI000DC69DD7|nr:uncharacterized protein LOC112638428 [Camponotus floridanus]